MPQARNRPPQPRPDAPCGSPALRHPIRVGLVYPSWIRISESASANLTEWCVRACSSPARAGPDRRVRGNFQVGQDRPALPPAAPLPPRMTGPTGSSDPITIAAAAAAAACAGRGLRLPLWTHGCGDGGREPAAALAPGTAARTADRVGSGQGLVTRAAAAMARRTCGRLAQCSCRLVAGRGRAAAGIWAWRRAWRGEWSPVVHVAAVRGPA